MLGKRTDSFTDFKPSILAISFEGLTELDTSLKVDSLAMTGYSRRKVPSKQLMDLRLMTVWVTDLLRELLYIELVGSIFYMQLMFFLQMVLTLFYLRVIESFHLLLLPFLLMAALLSSLLYCYMSGVSGYIKSALLSPIGMLSERQRELMMAEYYFLRRWMRPSLSLRSVYNILDLADYCISPTSSACCIFLRVRLSSASPITFFSSGCGSSSSFDITQGYRGICKVQQVSAS